MHLNTIFIAFWENLNLETWQRPASPTHGNFYTRKKKKIPHRVRNGNSSIIVLNFGSEATHILKTLICPNFSVNMLPHPQAGHEITRLALIQFSSRFFALADPPLPLHPRIQENRQQEQLTSWARMTISPVCRISVDFPPMLGPVTMTTRLPACSSPISSESWNTRTC